MDTENMGYEDEYAEHYQLQDQAPYDGDGAGYVQQNQLIVGSNPNASSLFRSEEMALCQLFLQVIKLFNILFLWLQYEKPHTTRSS
jgi:hypothetical protein